MSLSFDDCYELNLKTEEIGQKWAEAHSTVEFLEDAKKSLLASLMNKYDDGEMSEKKLERMAMADADYTEFLKNLREGRALATQYRVEYDKLLRECEFKRSEKSLLKEQMKLQ